MAALGRDPAHPFSSEFGTLRAVWVSPQDLRNVWASRIRAQTGRIMSPQKVGGTPLDATGGRSHGRSSEELR